MCYRDASKDMSEASLPCLLQTHIEIQRDLVQITGLGPRVFLLWSAQAEHGCEAIGAASDEQLTQTLIEALGSGKFSQGFGGSGPEELKVLT